MKKLSLFLIAVGIAFLGIERSQGAGELGLGGIKFAGFGNIANSGIQCLSRTRERCDAVMCGQGP